MQALIRPAKLNPGDKVAAVSLSWGGPGAIPHRYQAGKQQLEATFGVQVVEMPHTLSDPDWLRRHPQARADDLMQAFSDPTIKAIISTIGGDDSIRILPYLDPDVIRNNPKIFMGYSDTTITHFACLKAGLASFYGPAIMAGFGENGGLLPYMVASVRKCLFSAEPVGRIKPNTDGWTVEQLDWADPANQTRKRKLQPCQGWNFVQKSGHGSGQHRGRLIGGCIEVLDWLRGTDFWPGKDVWQDAVLFLETSEEGPSPQVVARILRAFAATGFLQNLQGMLFGRPGGQIPPKSFVEYDQVLKQVLVEELGLEDLPIVTGMDFGHTDPIMVLPYGMPVAIDCDLERITFLENSVVD
jgi:muramoyltetrapeptide carboxypeptidase LdcA involved in peptidoglycan recycling